MEGASVGLSEVPAAEATTGIEEAARTRSSSHGQRRRPEFAGSRQEFLSGLLNGDLQDLTKWHGSRPAHEQRRFLKGVDTLYRQYSRLGKEKPRASARVARFAQADQTSQQTAAPAVDEDLFGESPRRLSAPEPLLVGSASTPSLPSRPIHVFEQKKREQIRKGLSKDSDEPRNNLQRWLDDESTSSGFTGTTRSTSLTNLTSMTKTSASSSVNSAQVTTNQASFRGHRRGIAANQRKWAAQAAHAAGNLKDGIPHMSYPDVERMKTSFGEDYGISPLGINMPSTIYENVLRNDQHPFVAAFLRDAPQEQRNQFGHVVRALQFHRRMGDTKSSMRSDFDLDENSRLWKPLPTRPSGEPKNRNVSRVPLGTVSTTSLRRGATLRLPPAAGHPPASPTVSDLSSLPLYPPSTPSSAAATLGMKDPP